MFFEQSYYFIMAKIVQIAVSQERLSLRLRYVCQWVFAERLAVECEFVEPGEVARHYRVDIAYGVDEVTAGLHIQPAGCLEPGAMPGMPGLGTWDSVPIPVWADQSDAKECDIFSSIFWGLSRMEEYGAGGDTHGRFAASDSWSARHDLLEMPWVDAVVVNLAIRLGLSVPMRARAVLPSLDIDEAYAFRGRPYDFLKGIAGDLWRGRPGWLAARLRWLLGASGDPFDTFHEIKEWLGPLAQHCHVFFLVSATGHAMDRNMSSDHRAMRQLIREWARDMPIGVHPSYGQLERPELIGEERRRLELVSGREVISSRFHFLRFRLPDSYRALLAYGITEDHSMLYADALGFRAGTAAAFQWYDLEAEACTALRVQPYALMDRTLEQYLQLDAEAGLMRLAQIKRVCKEWGLPLAWIWHNSTIRAPGPWSDYVKIREELMHPD